MEKSEVIAKWSELYRKQISETEYDEICRNLSNFLGLLHEWDKEDKHSNTVIDKIA